MKHLAIVAAVLASTTSSVLAETTQERIVRDQAALTELDRLGNPCSTLAEVNRLAKLPRGQRQIDPQCEAVRSKARETLAQDQAQLQKEVANQQSQLAAEQEKRMAEQRKIQSNPEFILGNAYRGYAYLQVCHQTREGYLVVYVNDIELDRAHKAIKAIEQKLLVQYPNLNTAAIWNNASDFKQANFWVSLEGCQQQLDSLLRSSPEVSYTVERP